MEFECPPDKNLQPLSVLVSGALEEWLAADDGIE